jgi:prevent-host-death family protein
MLQIINISDARSNLAQLIQKVRDTKKPVVIVQDSMPSVVMYPYEDIEKREEETNQLFQAKFQKVFNEGKKSFGRYLAKNKKKAPKTEEEAYTLIKHA